MQSLLINYQKYKNYIYIIFYFILFNTIELNRSYFNTNIYFKIRHITIKYHNIMCNFIINVHL